MIFTNAEIKILRINELAANSGSLRFDKGSPSPALFAKKMIDYPALFGDFPRLANYYPDKQGLNSFRQTIKKIEKNVNGRSFEENQLSITNGSISAIFMLLGVICKPGDKVLLNKIAFEGFSSIITMLNLTEVRVDFSDHEALAQSIKTSKAKVLIFNTPENPSGKIYSAIELKGIAAITNKAGITVISDEVNNQNVYSGFKYVAPNHYFDPALLISVNSVSKNYYLPGLRVGWIVAPVKINLLFQKAIQVSQVAVTPVIQLLADHVINNFQKEISEFRITLEQKKELMSEVLDSLGFKYLSPVGGGAVYFVDSGTDGEKLSAKLITEANIAVVPGAYFGEDWRNYLRIGFGAVSPDEIRTALPQIKSAALSFR